MSVPRIAAKSHLPPERVSFDVPFLPLLKTDFIAAAGRRSGLAPKGMVEETAAGRRIAGRLWIVRAGSLHKLRRGQCLQVYPFC